jgi:hypothetical protein
MARPSAMELGLAGAATVCALFVASSATAEPAAEPALQWRATPSCSSTQQVREDISQILRQTPGSEREVAARVTLTQERDGIWKVALVTIVAGVSHQRRFDAESCSAAESAVSLILAIASNPNAALTNVDPLANIAQTAANAVPVPAPAASREELDLASERREPKPTSDSARQRSLTIAAGLALDLGTDPSATEGLALGLGYRHKSVRLELFGNAWAERSQTARDTAAGARFRLLSTVLRLGYGWSLGRVELGPLLGIEVASLRAAGFGGSRANFEQSRSLGGLTAGGFAALEVDRQLSVDFEFNAARWLNRPSFVVAEPAPTAPSLLYRPALAVAQAQLAVCLHFF